MVAYMLPFVINTSYTPIQTQLEPEVKTLANQHSGPRMTNTAPLGSTAWYPAVLKQYC